jgi:6-phosphogluconate dehydrogenase
MLPAGAPTDSTLGRLLEMLEAGDAVIDGGNSRYHDALRHGAAFAERGIGFLDVGVSGGVWGLTEGYGLMIGGTGDAVARLEPVFRCLAPAPDQGWVHCGPVGSGHYVKMVHNGIEYGMMQSLAEGLALLEAADEFELDTAAVAQSWCHGSVIRSWLLDLTAEFLAANPDLDGMAPVVQDSGEGRWTVIDAVERGVPTPAIAAALAARFASQGAQDTASKMLSAMRHAFGGHAMPVADPQ